MFQLLSSRVRRFLFAASIYAIVGLNAAWAQPSFEGEPVNYSSAPTDDPITRLQEQIDGGRVQLEYDTKHGYLPAVLKALGIPPESQMLVFSKTSLQRERISSDRPRAIYFNDDAYVGWVRYGRVLEVSAVDPGQGAIFYSLAQRMTERPQFVRDRGDCMACHASSRTWNVPGHVVRSVFTAPDGQPHNLLAPFIGRPPGHPGNPTRHETGPARLLDGALIPHLRLDNKRFLDNFASSS